MRLLLTSAALCWLFCRVSAGPLVPAERAGLPAAAAGRARPPRAATLHYRPFFPAPFWRAPAERAGPGRRPFLVSRRSHVPAVLPWRRAPDAPARTPPSWPSPELVHGKDVHWPAMKRDGFMLHHHEVNRGHHHRVHFGTLPSENGLMDMMIL